ncbi:hypothetical protein [Pontibacter ruber]|uniref:Glycosyl transferase n=1 Tax=Pontibacter ruber TaxID=1343895 RepID=A0ABW5D3N6_9BACT|nr:hypothetical protein [Pontibacter ruber]
MQRHLLYQAYGNEDILHELIYSIYSLLRVYGDSPFTLVVYTDNQAMLEKWLPPTVVYEPLTQVQIKQWRGKYDFVHRVKIEIIRDFISKYKGSALYLDTDTVITQPIDQLFEKIEQGVHVMHEEEGRISTRKNIVFRKVDSFLGSHNTGISRDTVMYNAGALGFLCSEQQLMEQVLQTTDKLYELYQKHIIEQLAFSYHLDAASSQPVYSATSEIYHYWNFKEYRGVLRAFFRHYEGTPYQELVPRIELINTQRMHAPKLAYEALPSYRRTLRKLSGTRWVMPAYTLS